jgi:hypothetical protein
MNIKIMLLGLLFTAFFTNCDSSRHLPGYLPKPDEIDVNQYGSYIKINKVNKDAINGEIIAIDSSQLVVLIKKNGLSNCVSVPLNEVNRFTIQYAKSKHYGWTIPVFTFSTITHGFLSILTAPVNLIVTTSVTAGGAKAFKYSEKDITFDKLKMFARFPQGIPPNIDTAQLK